MGHPVSIIGPSGSLFPVQGSVIDSSGSSGSSTRRVEVTRGFRELPGIFENAAISGGGISL